MNLQSTFSLRIPAARHVLIICLLLLTSSFLSACGKKGPLYIADDVAAKQADNKDKAKKSAEKIHEPRLEPLPTGEK